MYNCIYWVINIGISTSLYIYIYTQFDYLCLYTPMKLWEHVTWDWESHVFLVSTIHQWLIILEPVLWTCYIVLHVCLLVKNCHVMRWNIVSCNVMETYFVETNIWYLSCLMFCLVLVCYVLLCSVMSCHCVISHVTQCDAQQCNVSYDIVCAVWYGMIWHMLTHNE